MTQVREIRAMIRAAAADNVVNGVVLDLLRKEQEQICYVPRRSSQRELSDRRGTLSISEV
jgi:hypothetical protein